MLMLSRLIVPGLCLTLLAGCLPVDAPPRTTPRDDLPPVADGMPFRHATPAEQADRCGASGLQGLVGRSWPQPVPAHLGDVRVFVTGEPVTLDYRPDRLNVELAPGRQRIVAVGCG